MSNQPESPKTSGLRKITPHKGGRTISKRFGATPEVNQMLRTLWRQHKISLGDLVEKAARAEIAAIAAESDDK